MKPLASCSWRESCRFEQGKLPFTVWDVIVPAKTSGSDVMVIVSSRVYVIRMRMGGFSIQANYPVVSSTEEDEDAQQVLRELQSGSGWFHTQSIWVQFLKIVFFPHGVCMVPACFLSSCTWQSSGY